MDTKLTLSGLTCPACAKLAKKRLEKIPGVLEASVEINGEATIRADHEIANNEVRSALAGSGYNVK